MRPRPYRERTLLFAGLLFSDRSVLPGAFSALQDCFGHFLFVSEPFPWEFSEHYDDELGGRASRSFVFFPSQFDPSGLASVKHTTIAIENSLARHGKRTVNIDPGYLALSKVVLASAKNYSHRIYLGQGVYGELTLRCLRGRFVPLPYTYFDYQDARTLTVFESMRSLMKELPAVQDNQVVPVDRLV